MDLFNRIVKAAESISGKKINTSDRNLIEKMLEEYKKSDTYTANEIVLLVSNDFLKQRRDDDTENGEPITIDTHELMKTQIGKRDENDAKYSPAFLTNETVVRPDDKLFVDDRVNLSKLLNANSMYDFINLLNPSALYKKAYIILDSDYASSRNIDGTVVTWNFSNTADITDNGYNALGNIRDIVSMKLYKYNISFLTPGSSNRFSILLEEFRAQSFLAANGRRFHFITPPYDYLLPSTNPVPFMEPYNYGNFYFAKPMTVLDQLSISIGDPFIVFPLGFKNTIANVSGTFYIQVTFVNLLAVNVTTSAPAFTTNTRVIFKDFTTSNPSADADLISYILTHEFTLTVTSSTTGNIIIAQTPNYVIPPVGVVAPFTLVTIPSRFSFQLELTYIDAETM